MTCCTRCHTELVPNVVVVVTSVRLCVVRSTTTHDSDQTTTTACYSRRRRSATPSRRATVTDDDVIVATCSLTGSPRPFARWQVCDVTGGGRCRRLTDGGPGVAELNTTGANLPAGNRTLQCTAQYLDVFELMWSMTLLVLRTVSGKLCLHVQPVEQPVVQSAVHAVVSCYRGCTCC